MGNGRIRGIREFESWRLGEWESRSMGLPTPPQSLTPEFPHAPESLTFCIANHCTSYLDPCHTALGYRSTEESEKGGFGNLRMGE